MIPNARHTVADFAGDLDFAARSLLGQVRPPFGIVWTDLDKGSGFVVMSGTVQGARVLRAFRLASDVSPTTVPLTDTESEVRMNGRLRDVKAAGQVDVEEPVAEAPHGDIAVRGAFAFLARAMPGWTVAWCRSGITSPVAILTRDIQGMRRWLFVQVHAHSPAGARALVDLSLTSEDLARAMRAGQAQVARSA